MVRPPPPASRPTLRPPRTPADPNSGTVEIRDPTSRFQPLNDVPEPETRRMDTIDEVSRWEAPSSFEPDTQDLPLPLPSLKVPTADKLRSIRKTDPDAPTGQYVRDGWETEPLVLPDDPQATVDIADPAAALLEAGKTSDLPTMDIDADALAKVAQAARNIERVSKAKAREKALSDPISPRQPARVKKSSRPGGSGRGSWVPWILAGGAALLLVGGLSGGWVLMQQRELGARAVRLDEDARRTLALPLPLAGEAAVVSALRVEADALRGARWKPNPDRLALAVDRIRTLEGLLALANGDPKPATSALAQGINAPGCAAALAAGLKVRAGEEGASEGLSEALKAGILRAELRIWRARARLQAGLSEPGQAQATLEDLRALAQIPGLYTARERVLEAHAHLALGKVQQAATTLAQISDPPADLRRTITLAQVEASLARGSVKEALGRLEPLLGTGHADARDLARKVLARAAPILSRLDAEKTLPDEARAELIDLLHLARRLSGEPLPDDVLLTLLQAVRHGAKKGKLPSQLCLALASLGSKGTKREVLVLVYRRLLVSRRTTERVELNFLLCLLVGAQTPGDMSSPDRVLGGLRDPETQVELYFARALAWESLRRYRRALVDLSRALKLRPNRPELETARKRVVAALRKNPAEKRR